MTLEEAKTEIKENIKELYENGKHHAEFVQKNGNLVAEGLQIALDILKKVDAERKKGKWIWLSSTYDRIPCEMRFACSECDHEVITHDSDPWERFCPQCGADMRGERDE